MTTFLSEHNAAPCSLYLSLGFTIQIIHIIYIYTYQASSSTPYHTMSSTLHIAPCSLYLSLCFTTQHTPPPLLLLPYFQTPQHLSARYCVACSHLHILHTPPPVNRVEGVFYQTQLVHTCTMHIQHHHYHEWRVYFTKPNFARYFIAHTCAHTPPPVNRMEGVFYQTQRGETTCEMRHYIIGLTRSHAYHHHHHLHLDTTQSSSKSPVTNVFDTKGEISSA